MPLVVDSCRCSPTDETLGVSSSTIVVVIGTGLDRPANRKCRESVTVKGSFPLIVLESFIRLDGERLSWSYPLPP